MGRKVQWFVGAGSLVILGGGLYFGWARHHAQDQYDAELVNAVASQAAPKMISDIWYDEKTRVLTVFFSNRPRRVFPDTPPEKAHAFVGAADRDAWYRDHFQ